MEFIVGLLAGIILTMNYPGEIRPWYVKLVQVFSAFRKRLRENEAVSNPVEK